MAKVTYYLSNKVNKTGSAQLLLYFSYSGKRIPVATDEFIKPTLWNSAKKRMKGSAAAATTVNSKLEKWAGEYGEVMTAYRALQVSGKSYDSDDIKAMIQAIINPTKETKPESYTFRSWIEYLIANPSVKAATLKTYNNTNNRLKEYEAAKRNKRPLQFNDIDLDFYHSFVQFLNKEKPVKQTEGENKKPGLAKNTIGSHIKNIKKFMNEAFDRGLTENIKFKNKKFKTLSEESDTVYLNNDELTVLYELNLSDNKKLDQVRDRFLISAYTGLRFSDLQRLTSGHIVGDYIKIKTQKTDEDVTIPLHHIVRSIIHKYNNDFPAPISNQKMNAYLKELARDKAKFTAIISTSRTISGDRIYKTSAKYELISSHTARRSFATNAYLDGIPPLIIMAITGHRTEKAFLKYIKVTKTEHATKLLNLWNDKARSGLKAV